MSIENNFLQINDSLAADINKKANELYNSLLNFDATKLDTEDFYKNYFIKHHLDVRLFFSIENSAAILYKSIKKSNKVISELNIVDYGAGLGTLFMLGSMLGVKRFIYNDHLAEWTKNAAIICNNLKINVTDFIVGDIEEVIDYANKNNFKFDIVVSRNVIEHIYNLSNFYEKIHAHNASSIVFSTTTANYHNIAARLQHQQIHKKAEKLYYNPQRTKAIQKIIPTISAPQLATLVEITRGRAKEDFTNAVNNFLQKKIITPVEYLSTNTVDCEIGLWAEHLLPKNVYQKIITDAGFKLEYSAGFWDTHYKNNALNFMAKFLNKIIKSLGSKGYIVAPFINVVAY